MNLIEKFVYLLGWLRIVISPLSAGAIIGFLYARYNPGTTGMLIGIGIGVVGLILGIVWAESVRRRNDTINFLSKEIATPELDHPEKENKTLSPDDKNKIE